MYGQLAGAYYGKTGIPKMWITSLKRLDLIESIIYRLFEHLSTKILI
ncbi:hypothetical protein [Methanobacterium sp. MZ-A1]|nr:hypothetical protein [Methanobacterium sp. MZ-A1]